MAARRKKNPYRARLEPWAPYFVPIFGNLVDGFTPPAAVRVYPGKAHVTVSGVFVDHRGVGLTCRVRLVRDPHSDGLLVETRDLLLRFTSRKGGA